MVVRAAEVLQPGLLYPPPRPPGFPPRWGDFSPAHARPANTADYNGLLLGLPDTLDPWDNITRREAAQILYNLLRYREWLPGAGDVELAGPFPENLPPDSGIIHERAVTRSIGSFAKLRWDSWYEPDTGWYRGERTVEPLMDEATVDTRVVTDKRVFGFDTGSHMAWDLSLEVARRISEGADPAREGGEFARRLGRVREYLEEGLLQEKGREVRNGREAIIYKGVKPISSLFTGRIGRLVADAATLLSLEETEIGAYGTYGTVSTVRFADYEVLAAAQASQVFSVEFPPGYRILTDEDLLLGR